MTLLPSLTQLSVGAPGGDEQGEMVSEIMKTAYETWLSERSDPEYIRSWPSDSPWTEAGAKKRVQICISDINPFAVLHFYRSLSFPDLRERVVQTLVAGCRDMGQLAENMTKLFNHDTIGHFTSVIQIRGRDECIESDYIKYVYKSSTVCISTSTDEYSSIKTLVDSGMFYIFPKNLSVNEFLATVEYWKVLDLFWGYKVYSEDHTTDFDSARHMFMSKNDFMTTDTGHDVELKTLLYSDDANLEAVAQMALQKLADVARSDDDLFYRLQTLNETVFMINTHAPPSRSYTFDSFYEDTMTYDNAMKKFGM
jgi:hypothetical protein